MAAMCCLAVVTCGSFLGCRGALTREKPTSVGKKHRGSLAGSGPWFHWNGRMVTVAVERGRVGIAKRARDVEERNRVAR